MKTTERSNEPILPGSSQSLGEFQDLENRLRILNLSDRSRSASTLRQRLLVQAEQREHLPFFRGEFPMLPSVKTYHRLAFGGLAFMLFLSLLAFPPVRAAAQDFLAQIGLFQVTDQAISLNPDTPGDTVAPTAEPPAFAPIEAPDPAAAAQAAGFELYLPEALPAGFTLHYRSVQAVTEGKSVLSTYTQSGDSQFLSLAQIQHDPQAGAQEMAVGEAPVSEVTVRGLPGVWIEGYPMGVQLSPQEQTEVLPVNLLMWEERGFTFWLTSGSLPQEQMMEIAEGLAP